MRFTTEEARKQFLMKMSYAYFKNCAFRALDIAPTLDVPVLFLLLSMSTCRQLGRTESPSIDTIKPAAFWL